jgi:AcrR family transcriptional regulator
MFGAVATYPVGDRTRQEILEAALQLLADRGYHAVSVNDIARAAGCSKASVLYHFKAKVDILAALMEPVVEDYDTIHRSIEGLSPTDAQTLVIREYVDLILRRKQVAAITRLELAKLLWEDAMAPLLRAGAFLPAALAAGRSDEAAQVASMFAIFGVLGAGLQDFSDLPDAELREHLVDCLTTLLRPLAQDGLAQAGREA